MDDIHVTVLWVVSLTHGKVRATLSQLLHHDRRRQRECFSENRGCALGKSPGDEVVLNRGIIWRDSVLNRVFNFVQVGPLFSLGIILTGGLRVLPSEDQHIRHLNGYSFLLRLNNL